MITEDILTDYRLEHGVTREEAMAALGEARQNALEDRGLGNSPTPKNIDKNSLESLKKELNNFKRQDFLENLPKTEYHTNDFTQQYGRLKNSSDFNTFDLETLKPTPIKTASYYANTVDSATYKHYNDIFDTLNDNVDSFGNNLKIIDNSVFSGILKIKKEDEKKALASTLDAKHAKSIEDIKEIAKNTTGYYDELVDENGNFKENVKELPYTKRLNEYTTNEHMFWKDLAINYNSILDNQGESAAKDYIHKKLNDVAYENATIGNRFVKLGNRWGNDFVGLGATVAGVAGGLAKESLKAAYAAFDPNYEYNKTEANGWLNFWDQVLDNEVTRFGSDVMTYGLWNSITGESDKMRESGYRYTSNTFEEDPDGDFINRNTLFNIAGFMGFTGAMGTATKTIGYGTKMLSNAAANVAKKEAKNAAVKKVLNLSSKALDKSAKAIEKSTPYLMSTVEGDMAYIDTKTELYRTGIENSKMVFQNKNQERFMEKYKNDSDFNEEINKKVDEFYYGHLATGKSEKEALESAKIDAYNYGVDYLKEQNIEEWNALEENADIQSKRAGLWAFGIHQIIDGVVLHGAQKRLIDPAWEKTLKFKQKYKYTNAGGKTQVSSNRLSTGRKVWEYAKEPLGEFVQEYGATITDTSAKEFGDYSIEKYLENYAYSGDAFSELGKYAEGSMGYFWNSVKESAQSKEAFISGVYGAIGSIVGAYDITPSNYYGQKVGKDGKVSTGFKFRKQANESWWEYARRITPMSNPILQAHDGIKELENRIEKNTSRLQAIVDNDDSKKGLLTAAKIMSWEKALDNSLNNGDAWGARHSSLGAVIETAIALENSNSEVWKPQMLKHLEAVANISEATEEEKTKYIAEVRQENSELYSTMSDQEILKMSEDNAKKILTTLESVREESKKIDEELPNIDIETKEAILFSKLRAKQAEQNKKELDEELSKLKINNSVEDSGMSKDEKKASLKYGNTNIEKSLNDKKEALQKSKISLDTKKKKLKISKDKEEKNKIKEEIQSEKNEIENLESQIKYLEEDLKYSDKISTKVLSEQEIMNLSDVERGKLFEIYESINNLEKILKDNNTDDNTKKIIEQMLQSEKNKISEKQIKVLDNLIKQSQVKDGKFVEKVISVGEYQKIIDTYAEDYSKIAKDNNYLRKYIVEAKKAAKKSMAKAEHDKLMAIDNIQDFDKAFRDLADRDYNTAVLIAENLEGSDSKIWKEFNDIEKNQALWEGTLSEEQKSNLLSQNEKLNVLGTLRYLNVKGINANNPDEVLAALVDPNTGLDNKEYVDYLFNLYKNNGEYSFLGFGVPYGLIQKYSKKHEDNIKVNENLKMNTSEVTLEDPNIEEDIEKTEKTEEEVVQENKETLENSTTENEKSLVEDVQKTPEEKRKGSITSFINGYKNSNTDENTLNAVKDKVLNILNSSDSELAFVNSIKDTIKNESSKSIKSALTDLIDSYILSKFEGVRPGHKRTDVNPNSGQMETSNMSWISKEFPNSPISKFWKKHKIDAYLNKNSKNIESGKKDVLFITDSDLTAEVKSTMGNNYSNDTDLPIIAVVQDDNGSIEIDGIKYQPISILPASDNNNKNGINRVGAIRKQALNHGDKTKIIKDNNANAIKSSIVGKITPHKIQKSESPISVLNSTQQTSDKNSEEYQKNKKQFFDNLKVEKFENRSGVVHTSEDGTKVEIFVQPLERSTHIENGETIEQVFNKSAEQIVHESSDANTAFGTIQNKLKYNKLILKAARELYKTTSSIFNNLNAENIKDKSNDDVKKLLNDIAIALNTAIGSDGLYLNTPKGFEWRVIRKYDEITESFIPGEYELAFGFISENGNINKSRKIVSIPLNTNSVENIKEESVKVAYDAIKQLCLDDSGNVREGEERKEQHYDKGAFVRFNVSFYEFVGKSSKKNGQSQQNIELYAQVASDVYDDGLLFSMYQDYSSESGNVVLAGPRMENQNSESTNTDNADFAKGVSENIQNPTIHYNNPKDVENNVNKMIEDSKDWEVTKDEKHYNKKGESSKSIRVTSLIQADPEVTKFDDESPYALPSTTFGNNVDNLIRKAVSVFNDTTKEGKDIGSAVEKMHTLFESIAPNMSKKDATDVVNQVFTTLNILQIQGYKVVSDKIVARGSMRVADKKGTQHNLNVAGTIDLLMYNENTGEYNIIDIKTKRGGGFDTDVKTMQKYAKQLYLYKTFLENTYGIKISNTYVMGFGVGYVEPVKGIVDYFTDDSGVLKINTPSTKNEVATPLVVTMEFGNGIGGLHEVTTRGVHVVYEDLHDYNREVIVENFDVSNPSTGTEVAKTLSEVENNNSENSIEVLEDDNKETSDDSQENDEEVLNTINFRTISKSNENSKNKAVDRIIKQIKKNKNTIINNKSVFVNSRYYKNLSTKDKLMVDNIIKGEINESEEDWLYELFNNENAALAVASLLNNDDNKNIKTSGSLKQAEKECK